MQEPEKSNAEEAAHTERGPSTAGNPKRPRRSGPRIDLTKIPAAWVAGGVLILAAIALALWILAMPGGRTTSPTPTPAITAPPTVPAAARETPTPAPPQVRVGAIVKVVGTEGQDLRLREEPSLQSTTLHYIKEGAVLQVTEGPAEADGHTWWKVRDQDNKTGWAASDWLAPQGTSP